MRNSMAFFDFFGGGVGLRVRWLLESADSSLPLSLDAASESCLRFAGGDSATQTVVLVFSSRTDAWKRWIESRIPCCFVSCFFTVEADLAVSAS